jgi:hypothetical protein
LNAVLASPVIEHGEHHPITSGQDSHRKLQCENETPCMHCATLVIKGKS